MATLGFIEYADASPEVRAVYDDIMRTRNTDWINNFWKGLAHDPATLRRTWQSVKEVMTRPAPELPPFASFELKTPQNHRVTPLARTSTS